VETFWRASAATSAAHSGGSFTEGISAIEELARKIQALHALTDLERAFINRRIAEEEGEVRRLTARRQDAPVGARQNAPFHAAITADDRYTSS